MLIQARALAARFPWLTTIAPLSREQSVAVPTTGYDDVRAVALARLALPGIPNVQVDWAQYGPKLAQVALTFGANDLDRVSVDRRRVAGPAPHLARGRDAKHHRGGLSAARTVHRLASRRPAA